MNCVRILNSSAVRLPAVRGYAVWLTVTSCLVSCCLAVGSNDEVPLLPETVINPVTELFERQIGGETGGGVAIVTDAAGSCYFAAGNSLTKFGPNGGKLWSRTHVNHSTQVISNGLTQYSYSESWGDGTAPIYLGTSSDSGELVDPAAQKVILDAAGNIYVNFNDLLHGERSLVVKFDPTGRVLWRHISDFPMIDGLWQSKLHNMLLVPGHLVILETLQDAYSNIYRTRLVIFPLLGGADRNGSWDLKKLYGPKSGTQLFGHQSIGVGLGLAANGDLLFATHDGPVSGTPASPEAQPTKLFLRKLVPPYLTTGSTAGHESSRYYASLRAEDEWNDLGVAADGNLYISGTRYVNNGFTYYYQQLAASFRGTDLGKRWSKALVTNQEGAFSDPGYASGQQILIHAGGVTIASGSRDFRNDFGGDEFLTLARLGFDGTEIWKKYQYMCPIHRAVGDDAGNVFLVGGPYDDFAHPKAISFWKYSAAGRLQYQLDRDPPVDRSYNMGISTDDNQALALGPNNKLFVVATHSPDSFSVPWNIKAKLLRFQYPKVPQTITFSTFASTLEFGVQPVSLGGMATSGLAVTYNKTGPIVLEPSQFRMTGLGAVSIVAHQKGDASFAAAADITRSFIIRDTTPPLFKKLLTSVASTQATTSLVGVAQDNFKLASLKYRVKAPGGIFGDYTIMPFISNPGVAKSFNLGIPTPTKGTYTVEIQAIDSLGLKQAPTSISIVRS